MVTEIIMWLPERSLDISSDNSSILSFRWSEDSTHYSTVTIKVQRESPKTNPSNSAETSWRVIVEEDGLEKNNNFLNIKGVSMNIDWTNLIAERKQGWSYHLNNLTQALDNY